MKGNETFFVSKEYESQIKANDFYDEHVETKDKNVIKEFELIDDIIYLKLSHFNYLLRRQYPIDEIYINNQHFSFKETLMFDVKKYKHLNNNQFELTVCIDQKEFWKALENEY